jgi:prevent-host-death family protein
MAQKNRRRSKAESRTVSATEAQNNFGDVLVRARRDGEVYITKYDRPAAVVLSIERYRTLTGGTAPDLEALTREFDQMVARMQTRAAAAGADALFEMGSGELGQAAVRGAKNSA